MAKSIKKQVGAKVAPEPDSAIDAEKKSSTQRIFGAKVMDHGYTALPNILMRGQKRLGISTTQFNIVAQLMSYWFDPARPPFPSKRDLAQRMGITEQRQSTTLTEKPNARANARNTKGKTDGSPE